MPCYDPEDRPSRILERAKAQCRHNSDVAQILCEVMTKVMARGNLPEFSDDAMKWWQEHTERDKAKQQT